MKKILLILLITLELFAAPSVEDKAVSFTLPNLYNLKHSTSTQSLKGKVVLLNLWASWCSGCKEEMPKFVALQKEFSKDKFQIVLSSIDSDPSNAIEFLEDVDKEKLLTALYDADKKLPKAYRCIAMPSSFLISKEGKIIKIYVGSLDDTKIEELKKSVIKLIGK